MWPFEFECTYEVTLRREKLKCEFCVKNCADDLKDELEFTAALHSYIEVVDADGFGKRVRQRELEG